MTLMTVPFLHKASNPCILNALGSPECRVRSSCHPIPSPGSRWNTTQDLWEIYALCHSWLVASSGSVTQALSHRPGGRRGEKEEQKFLFLFAVNFDALVSEWNSLSPFPLFPGQVFPSIRLARFPKSPAWSGPKVWSYVP